MSESGSRLKPTQVVTVSSWADGLVRVTEPENASNKDSQIGNHVSVIAVRSDAQISTGATDGRLQFLDPLTGSSESIACLAANRCFVLFNCLDLNANDMIGTSRGKEENIVTVATNTAYEFQ